MAKLFPFPGFLLETAGVVFIVYGLITGRSMLVTLGAVMLGLGLLLTVFGMVLLPRGAGPGRRGRSRGSPGPGEDNAGSRPEDPADPDVGYSSPVLYSDGLVRISGDAITFLHYSFPFGSPRSVGFAEIDHITCEAPTVANGKWRIWGTGSFSVWFPLDSRRPERDRIFFATLAGKKMRIGFTVEDPEQVMRVLAGKGVFSPGDGCEPARELT